MNITQREVQGRGLFHLPFKEILSVFSFAQRIFPFCSVKARFDCYYCLEIKVRVEEYVWMLSSQRGASGKLLLASTPNSLEWAFLYGRSGKVKKYISDFLTPELRELI